MYIRISTTGKTIFADFRDMNSVSKAADLVIDQVAHIDILVCNAGICYLVDDDQVDQVGCSVQGYDDCFQINYLSHFLFTEKLLKKGTDYHNDDSLDFISNTIPAKSIDSRPLFEIKKDRLIEDLSRGDGISYIRNASHVSKPDSFTFKFIN